MGCIFGRENRCSPPPLNYLIMSKIMNIKGKNVLPKEDDCGCGRALKVNDPKRSIVKRTVKKKL
jgi:hypothetical protein